ncbi:MAG: HPr kinase/phosphatase C-terminal domain-containing protein [Pseudomonadota bacterium]
MAVEIVHASAVEFEGNGVLITGPSGCGKSSLALQLMAFGARLVADDQTEVRTEGEHLVVRPPKTLPRLIEARGIGLLNAEVAGPTQLRLVVDLADREAERLPPDRRTTLLGKSLPLLRAAGHPALAPAVMQLLRAGRAV